MPEEQTTGSWLNRTVLGVGLTSLFSDWSHETATAVLPAFRFGAWLFSWLRVFQQGSIQTYLLYIFIALIALLLWH